MAYDPNSNYYDEIDSEGNVVGHRAIPHESVNRELKDFEFKNNGNGRRLVPEAYHKFTDDLGNEYDVPRSELQGFWDESKAAGKKLAPMVQMVNPETGEERMIPKWGNSDLDSVQENSQNWNFISSGRSSWANAVAGGWKMKGDVDPSFSDQVKALGEWETWRDANWDPKQMAASAVANVTSGITSTAKSAVGMALDVPALVADGVGTAAGAVGLDGVKGATDWVSGALRSAKGFVGEMLDTTQLKDNLADATGMDEYDRQAMDLAAKPNEMHGGIAGIGLAGKAVGFADALATKAIGTGLQAMKAGRIGAELMNVASNSQKMEQIGTTLAMASSGYESLYEDPDLKPLLKSGDPGDKARAQVIGTVKAGAMALGGKLVNKLLGMGVPAEEAKKGVAQFVEGVAERALTGAVEFAGFNDVSYLSDELAKGVLDIKDLNLDEMIQKVAGETMDGLLMGGGMSLLSSAGGLAMALGSSSQASLDSMRRGYFTSLFNAAIEDQARMGRIGTEIAASESSSDAVVRQMRGIVEGKNLIPNPSVLGQHRFVTPEGITITYDGGGVRQGADGTAEVVTPGGLVLDRGGERIRTITAGETPEDNVGRAVMLSNGMRGTMSPGEPVALDQIGGRIPGIKANEPGSQAKGGELPKTPVVLLRNDDGSLEIVTGSGRVEAARANGATEINAVILDAKDGWNRDNAKVVDAVENLRDNSITDGGDLVAAYTALGVNRAQAESCGLVRGRRQRAAFEVYENASPRLREMTISGACPLHVAAEIAGKFGGGRSGLGAELESALQEEVAARTTAASRSEVKSVCDSVRMSLDGLGRGVLDAGDMGRLVDDAIRRAAEVDTMDRAVENGISEKQENAVGSVMVEQPDGGMKPVREVERDIQPKEPNGTPPVAREPARFRPAGTVGDARRMDSEPLPSGGHVVNVYVEPDGRVLFDSIISPEEMRDPKNREIVGELLEHASEMGDLVIANRDQYEAAREILEERAEREDRRLRDEASDAELKIVVDAGNELLARQLGVTVRTGTEAEMRSALEEGTDLKEISSGDGAVIGYYDRDTREIVLFRGATVDTLAHEGLGHVVWQFAEENSPELLEKLKGVVKSAPEQMLKEIRDAYGDIGEDALMDEIFAHRIEKRLGSRLEKLIAENAEVKTWWESVKQFVADIWNGMMEALGRDGVNLDGIDRMTPDQAVDHVIDQILKGKKLKGLGVTPDRRGTTEVAVGEGTTVESDGKRYSIKSMLHDLDEGVMISDLVSKGIMSREEGAKLERNLRGLVDRMARDRFILDINETFGREDRPFNPLKPNSDPLYKISLDFSTLCKKRLLTQGVIERLQLDQMRVLSAEEQLAVRQLLLDYSKIDTALQVACHLCYVEAARLKAPRQQNRFFADPGAVVKDYFAKNSPTFKAQIEAAQAKVKAKYGLGPDATKNQLKAKAGSKAVTELNNATREFRKNYKPSAEEQRIISDAEKLDVRSYLSADNIAKLSQEHPEIYKAYTEFIRNSTHSKSLETDVPWYYGDSKVLTDSFVKTMNAQGTGLRHQSWSDFQIRHLLDTISAVCELSIRGAKMHAYTKVPAFARCFGRTGIMVNLSLIPELDGKGWSSKEGMAYDQAQQLRKQFPETCGTIAIAMSFDHLVKAINDGTIDYVIPYHKSGMNKGLRTMVGIDRWHDFESIQHERPIAKGDNAGVEKWHEAPEQGEWLIKEGGGNGYKLMVKSAERYLELCNERGLIPKFAEVPGLLEGKPGSYSLKNQNYWKLLIDHKMVNQDTKKLIIQQELRPDFDFDVINEEVNREVEGMDARRMDNAYEYVREHQDILPELASKLKKGGVVKDLLSKVQARKPAKPASGGKRLSIVGVRPDGIEVYSTKSTEGMTNAQRTQEFMRKLREDYRGRTARFTIDGVTYYATMGRDDAGKIVYGDTKTSPRNKKVKDRIGAAGDIFDLVEGARYRKSSDEYGKNKRSHRNVDGWDYFVKTVQVDNGMYDVNIEVRRKPSTTGSLEDEFVYNIILNHSNKKADTRFLSQSISNSEDAGVLGESATVRGPEVSTGGILPQAEDGVNGGKRPAVAPNAARRALQAMVYDGTRVTNPNANQEQSTFGREASAERMSWEANPQLTFVDPMDAPRRNPNIFKPGPMNLSELNRFYKAVTGSVLPVQTVGVMRSPAGGVNAGRMGWTTGDRVTVLKDVFGVVDATDMKVIKDRLVAMGFFQHEDPIWAATNPPARVEQMRRDSEQMLSDRLRNLGEDRISGRAPGGERAAINTMAANIGRVLIDLPNDVGGTVGHLRTLGQGLLRGFDRVRTGPQMMYYVQETADFLNWAHGYVPDPATGRMPAEAYDPAKLASDPNARKSAFGEMFGAFLSGPDSLAQRATGMYKNMLEAITYSPKLQRAYDDIRTTAVGEGSAARVMADIEQRRTWQAERDIQRLEEDMDRPFGTKLQQFWDSFVYNWSNIEGPMLHFMSRASKLQVKAAKQALKNGTITQADYDAIAGRYDQSVQQMKVSRLAMDRGRQNEIRSYLWDQDQLFEQAKADGVDMRDWFAYGEAQRCIELQGRAYEGGMDPRQARQILDQMQQRLGPARYQQIVELANKWQANREQHILDDARLEQAFGKDLLDYWRANVHYIRSEHVKMSPEEVAKADQDRAAWRARNPGRDDILVDMVERLGRISGNREGVGGLDTWTKRYEGSLRAKKDWFYSTLANDERLLVFAARNDYVLQMKRALQALEVDGVHDMAANDRVPWPENNRYGRINYVENGERRVLVVPRPIADVFKGARDSMDGFSGVGKFFHGVFIDFNLGYTIRNFTRNLHSNGILLAGMRPDNLEIAGNFVFPGAGRLADVALTQIARHMPDYVFRNPVSRLLFGRWTNVFYAGQAQRVLELYNSPRRYVERAAEADRAAAAGDMGPSDLLAQDEAMLKFCMQGNALISRYDRVRGLGQLDDYLRSRGFASAWDDAPKTRGVAQKIMDASTLVFRANAKVNADLELWAKITATLQQHDWNQQASAEEIGVKVAQGASIPITENGPDKGRFVNFAWQMFWKTAQAGFKRTAGAFSERPVETSLKLGLTSVLPVLFWKNTIIGGLGLSLLRMMYDGDDEKLLAGPFGGLARAMDYQAQAAKNISDYQQRNYESIAIGKWGGTTLSIAMPRTDEEKILLPFADWMSARMAPNPTDPTASGTDAAFRSTFGSLFPDVSGRMPMIAAFQDLILAWRQNPYDSYRNSQVYDQTLWDARLASAPDAARFAAETLAQGWNDLGGRTLMPFRRNNIDDGDEAPAVVLAALRKLGPLSTVLAGQLRLSTNGERRRERVANQMIAEHEAAKKARAADLLADMIEQDTPAPNGIEEKLEAWSQRYGWEAGEDMEVLQKAYNGWQARQKELYIRNGTQKMLRKGMKQRNSAVRRDIERWLDAGLM